MPPVPTYSNKAQSRCLSASRCLSICAGVAVLLVSAACRDVGPAFGPTIPAARANADGLFGGIAQRFTNVQRNAKFTVARGKLGKNALTPSAIYNDTSVWTAMGNDGTRTVTVEGGFLNNRYFFAAKPGANAQPRLITDMIATAAAAARTRPIASASDPKINAPRNCPR